MKLFRTIVIAAALSVPGITGLTSAAAQDVAVVSEAPALPSGVFVKKKKRLSGNWEVVQRGDQLVLVFDDTFRSSKGPDLKVFLSPQTVSEVTGKTAVDGAVLLGELESTKGGQEYVLPEGINIADFSSVLVHCEAYSILWGGGAL